MLNTYTNTTSITQGYTDIFGVCHVIEPGESVTIEESSIVGDPINLVVKTEVDGVGEILYIGYAKPGTGDDEPGWAIKKRVAVGLVETYPVAGGIYRLRWVWDDRAGYSYS